MTFFRIFLLLFNSNRHFAWCHCWFLCRQIRLKANGSYTDFGHCIRRGGPFLWSPGGFSWPFGYCRGVGVFGVLARTFTYGSYAAFVNLSKTNCLWNNANFYLAFENKFFGSIMGLTSVMCGAISFANDPFFAYIISPDGLDRNFKPVDVSIKLTDNEK